MNSKLNSALLVALCLSGLPSVSRADEISEKGRDIFTKNQRAVVTVQIVLKTTYSQSGQSSSPNESKQDITGTVVDPSGLTVCALSSADPGEMYQRMMSEQSRYKVDTEVSDIKILLDDGTELASEIVLRDKDLDLAFIRPKSHPAGAMTAIDLSKSSPAQVLDQVITLNRLNRASGRAYAASVERISAVVQKPRTFYVPDSSMSATALGSPAFLPNGNLLGIFVMRVISSGGGSSSRENWTSIILPAADILKAAKQAPAEAEKKETVPAATTPKAESKEPGKEEPAAEKK